MKELIESVKASEGFAAKPYIDVLVAKNPEKYGIPKEELAIVQKHIDKLKLTFGYGFTFITEDESAAVLEMRLKTTIKELEQREPFVNKLPLEVQAILAEMCFQMGVKGVLGFNDMWKALKVGDYIKASEAMLDSKWARQMHELDMQDGKDSVNRAERLAQKMREV